MDVGQHLLKLQESPSLCNGCTCTVKHSFLFGILIIPYLPYGTVPDNANILRLAQRIPIKDTQHVKSQMSCQTNLLWH